MKSTMQRGDIFSILSSPKSKAPLSLDTSKEYLIADDERYQKRNDVWILMDQINQEYEGAYLNKVKYVPRHDRFPWSWPLWIMVNGYLWEVRRRFTPGALICELGCASGVNYFGQRYSMIGLDYSIQSLQAIENYQIKIQADAIQLPFQDGVLDGIISSYFWEHILPTDKEKMLKEFRRVLKPGGKVVMLYDVETDNTLIGKLKHTDIKKYEALFLDGDFHIGYETMKENRQKFESNSFTILKHFGMERTWMQSNSVYVKLSTCTGGYGVFARIMKSLTSSGPLAYLHMLCIRVIDETLGRLWPVRRSRIAISVLERSE